MAEGKERTQRRVYVLPTELVERIVAYQQSLGLASEVEAARRLLDDALKQRDTYVTITNKVILKLKEVKSLREAAREVIADHPLVTSISFEENHLIFKLKSGHKIEVHIYEKATVYDEDDSLHDFVLDIGYIPEWASRMHPRRRESHDDLDDDNPF